MPLFSTSVILNWISSPSGEPFPYSEPCGEVRSEGECEMEALAELSRLHLPNRVSKQHLHKRKCKPPTSLESLTVDSNLWWTIIDSSTIAEYQAPCWYWLYRCLYSHQSYNTSFHTLFPTSCCLWSWSSQRRWPHNTLSLRHFLTITSNPSPCCLRASSTV